MATAISAAMATATAFIDEGHIHSLLEKAAHPSTVHAREIIARARAARGLSPEEAAVLLQVEDPEVLGEMLTAASEVKEAIYGKRIVLFAPLYLSDFCVNDCVYCGYGHSRKFARRRLSQQEIANEVRILESMGHKRLALEAGEDPVNCPIDYVLDSIRTIYAVHEKNGNIRRVNVNIAATTTENYRKLKTAGIGTYVLFQETYHRETYRRMHPTGPKADYDWHTLAMDRAMASGIDDVGLGVLFGLHDFRFEVLALLLHARRLEEVFGVGPHAHHLGAAAAAGERGTAGRGSLSLPGDRRRVPASGGGDPPGRAVYRHDSFDARGVRLPGRGHPVWDFAGERRLLHRRRRLPRRARER